MYVVVPKGYSMTAFSYNGRFNYTDTARIETKTEFVQPICLSLWYQMYAGRDCSLIVFKIFNGTQSSIYTANCSSEPPKQWIKISLDVRYEENPYKIALEAVFQNHSVQGVRVILIDDTSIAYRPCQGNYEHLSIYKNLHKQKNIEDFI